MFMRVLYNAWLITDCVNVSDDGLVSGTSVLLFNYVLVLIDIL